MTWSRRPCSGPRGRFSLCEWPALQHGGPSTSPRSWVCHLLALGVTETQMSGFFLKNFILKRQITSQLFSLSIKFPIVCVWHLRGYGSGSDPEHWPATDEGVLPSEINPGSYYFSPKHVLLLIWKLSILVSKYKLKSITADFYQLNILSTSTNMFGFVFVLWWTEIIILPSWVTGTGWKLWSSTTREQVASKPRPRTWLLSTPCVTLWKTFNTHSSRLLQLLSAYSDCNIWNTALFVWHRLWVDMVRFTTSYCSFLKTLLYYFIIFYLHKWSHPLFCVIYLLAFTHCINQQHLI